MEYVEVHSSVGSWDVKIDSIKKVRTKQDGTILIYLNGGLILDCVDTYDYIKWYLVRCNRSRLKIEGEV